MGKPLKHANDDAHSGWKSIFSLIKFSLDIFSAKIFITTLKFFTTFELEFSRQKINVRLSYYNLVDLSCFWRENSNQRKKSTSNIWTFAPKIKIPQYRRFGPFWARKFKLHLWFEHLQFCLFLRKNSNISRIQKSWVLAGKFKRANLMWFAYIVSTAVCCFWQSVIMHQAF